MCFHSDVQTTSPYVGGDPGAADVTTPVTQTTQKLTKLGKLAKIALPIMSAGMMEGFGGRGTYQNFESNQQEMSLRAAQEQRQAALTQKDLREPPPPRFPIGSPFDMIPEGETEPYQFNIDPYTGQPRKLGKAVPKEKPQNDTRIDVREANGGYFAIPTSGPNAGKASPVMTRDPKAMPTPAASMDAFGTEEPQPEAPTIPLEPYRKDETEPEPQAVTDTDAAGVSTTHFVDKNPKSKTFGKDMTPKPVATRHPQPKTASTKVNQDYVEKLAQAALQAEGNDGDKAIARINATPDAGMPGDYKTAVRNRIREIKRPGQPKKSLGREVLQGLIDAGGVQ